MSPETIENWRKILSDRYPGASKETNELCELALDGIRFRAWIEGATPGGGISRLVTLLAPCTTVKMYRKAIDQFIVERIKAGKL